MADHDQERRTANAIAGAVTFAIVMVILAGGLGVAVLLFRAIT